MRKKARIITICSSASFYREAIEIKKDLEKMVFKVVIPHTALKMQRLNDFKVENYKIWYQNPKDYRRKTYLMRKHFREVERADAIFVVNLPKHGSKGYIGGNVLMEMAIALFLKKVIYLLYPPDQTSPTLEEIIGCSPIILNGDLTLVKRLK